MAFLQAAGRSTQTIKDDRLVAASVAKWEERPCEGFVSLWKTENYLDKILFKKYYIHEVNFYVINIDFLKWTMLKKI